MKLTPSNRTTDQIRANLFMLGIISLITVVLWVGVSVYFSFTKTKVKSEIQTLITPINPSLDSDTLIQYRNSRVIPPATFQIIAKIEEGGKVSEQIIDPFNPNSSREAAVKNASTSASVTNASGSAELSE